MSAGKASTSDARFAATAKFYANPVPAAATTNWLRGAPSLLPDRRAGLTERTVGLHRHRFRTGMRAVVAPDPGMMMHASAAMLILLRLSRWNRASAPSLFLPFHVSVRSSATAPVIGDGLNMVAGAGRVIRSAAGKS